MKTFYLSYLLSSYILTLGFGTKSFAQSNLVPTDHDYSYSTDENYEYIFSDDYKKSNESNDRVKEVIKKNRVVNGVYEKSFDWKLDESVSMVLASPEKNQIANAFATVIPNHLTTFYGGGAHLLDQFATTSWLDTLLVHELAHLYQLNPKQGFGKFMDSVFGNNVFQLFPLAVFWVVPSPNIFTHEWLLEGNAVFNESRFGLGGRLYSGEYRALFNSLVKSGKLTYTRLINSHLEYPYGLEKYVVGSYFFLFLGERYGTDVANRFFVNHSGRYFNPFLMDKDFERTFGKGYYDLMDDFLAHYKGGAGEYKEINSGEITKSIKHERFSSIDNEVMFLTSDGYNPSELVRVKSVDGSFSKSKTDLTFGKLFKVKDSLYTLTSLQKNYGDILYGLWDEKEELLEESQGKYISDMSSDGEWLYHEVAKSYDVPHLSFKGKNFPGCNSLGVLDKKGSVYCFGTDKKNRVLYKDGKRIFAIDGFYSKLTEVVDGAIYFVSSTAHGSTLYKYANDKIYKMFDVDSVIDAKLLSGNSFLVANQTSQGISYNIVQAVQTLANPVSYRYYFEKEVIFERKLSSDSSLPELENVKSYNSFTNLSYSGFTYNLFLTLSSDSTDSTIHDITATFIDPTYKNRLVLNVESEQSDMDYQSQDEFSLLYQNSAYKIGWLAGITYHNRKIERSYLEELEVNVAAIYPFLKLKKYDFFAVPFYNYERRFSGNNSLDPGVKLNISRVEDYSLRLIPYKKTSIEFGIECEVDCKYVSKNVIVSTEFDLYKETMLGVYGEYVKSDYSLYEFKDQNGDDNIEEDGGFDYFSPSTTIDGFSYGASFRHLFNVNLLSTFPLAIRRVVPKVFYTGYEFKDRSFYEYGVGVSAELLFGYRMPFIIGVYGTNLENYGTNERKIGLTISKN